MEVKSGKNEDSVGDRNGLDMGREGQLRTPPGFLGCSQN